MSTENIKELDKVLDVGGELFNINAVRATQVDNKLVIKESSSEPDTYSDVEFDGSQAQEVAVVSADKGGYFNNPIGVPDTDVENITVENDGSTVLNYKAVSELIPLLTGSGWYTWGNSSLTALVNNQGITQHFGIVVGSRNDVVSFTGLNHKESTTEITPLRVQDFSAVHSIALRHKLRSLRGRLIFFSQKPTRVHRTDTAPAQCRFTPILPAQYLRVQTALSIG